MKDRLSATIVGDVLERFELPNAVPLDLEGLNRLSGAWCRHVPFDNIRKLLVLHGGEGAGELPGRSAEDFFTGWLEDGVAGTCWPTSNGLYMLLCEVGFVARRISASMFDLGVPNHGSVIVVLEEGDHLADSSLLTRSVLPLVPGQEARLDEPGKSDRGLPA